MAHLLTYKFLITSPPPLFSLLPQEIKEEAELVRKELLISQDRLAMCETNTRSHETREKACRHELALSQLAVAAAETRQSETEKELRQRDCASTRRNANKWRDTAEQYSIENDGLKKEARMAAEKWASQAEALKQETVKAKEQGAENINALKKEHSNKVEALMKT